jgi:hypothetical protein
MLLLALTPGLPLALTPGLPFGLTVGLPFCLGHKLKARVVTKSLRLNLNNSLQNVISNQTNHHMGAPILFVHK